MSYKSVCSERWLTCSKHIQQHKKETEERDQEEWERKKKEENGSEECQAISLMRLRQVVQGKERKDHKNKSSFSHSMCTKAHLMVDIHTPHKVVLGSTDV